MRHRVKGKKLGRTKSHKIATMRALALAIIEHKQVKTTLAKAKEARRYIERLVTYSKKDTVHARRLAYKFLNRHDAVKRLFDEIGPTFEGRNGGYTRVIKLGQRVGDGAEMALLQLVGFNEMEEVIPPKSKKKATKPVTESQKESKEVAQEEGTAAETQEAPEEKVQAKDVEEATESEQNEKEKAGKEEEKETAEPESPPEENQKNSDDKEESEKK